MPTVFRKLLTLSEAKDVALAHIPSVGEEVLPLDQAKGRILAEPVMAGIDVPGFPRAAMDGFAVRSVDTLDAREDRPVSLQLQGSVPMGSPPEVSVPPGSAVEVSTGSMMPPGADAVVMVEYCRRVEESVLVGRAAHGGENVQVQGSDIRMGETILYPGTMLGPREMGVLAAVGCVEVRVRSLRVSLASTGDELVEAGEALGPGQIYDINAHSLAAAVAAAGGRPLHHRVLKDDPRDLRDGLAEMVASSHLVILSGSTSAGRGDMLYQIIEEEGDLLFHGISLKPGKPTMMGLVQGKPVFGLPGYPTSALAVFGQIVEPVIHRALGSPSGKRTVKGRLSRPLRSEGRHQLVSVRTFRGRIIPVDKGSGSITTLSRADGFIEIPAAVEYLDRDQEVEVMLFQEPGEPDLVLAGDGLSPIRDIMSRFPFRVSLRPAGRLRSLADLQDGLADAVVVSDPVRPGKGEVLIPLELSIPEGDLSLQEGNAWIERAPEGKKETDRTYLLAREEALNLPALRSLLKALRDIKEL